MPADNTIQAENNTKSQLKIKSYMYYEIKMPSNKTFILPLFSSFNKTFSLTTEEMEDAQQTMEVLKTFHIAKTYTKIRNLF